ncbi:5'-nucleotidase C-terminal domain-containing protein [Limnospira fusiformis KN01]|uniref:5'-Nucleotidase domain protein n=2 Tax=Limnospira TaxID=2596745 RepID=B5W8D6_LIMMA|nr:MULTISPECIES: 5'-nucleotidase C-terminal domain-containing protein [Limnospira]EKD10381.1 5'-Nucleotidase domain protein [Arthrospira platensis C1]MDY7053997.1 5'-nucleotidase C-terminal domain-containing protein [Limnospira fusiformis LS22]QJB28203.1 multifunctional 2',3'-cyclic-nucleotide 2'-phosphodiesterase/5'-nucleotidase/3'-nucleotidase [Limnospira fusiformis SAG 85.79]EDZ92194.1 5'-Nucleotidase domain protein [Limnospira maxima CS-328]MDT9189419.1 5'-nucleotidase C-terminal domain-co
MKWAVRLYGILFVGAIFVGIAFHDALVNSQDFSLRLLHTNDHHARLESVEVGDNLLGGIARRKTLIDTLLAENETTTLLLDAGDIFQGTLYFNKYLGQADVPFYNQMNYAAVAIGNHEFDRGQETLAEFIRSSAFPMISSNLEIDVNSPLSDLIKSWIIVHVNREQIGILGLTTPDTEVLSSPGEGIKFLDPIAAAKKTVKILRGRGVNKIIALTHLGISEDIKLAQQVDGIDLIVGGHSHTPLGNIPGATQPYPLVETSPNGDNVLVVTDWEWGKYLGDLQVVFDGRGHLIYWSGSPHAVDESIIPDPDFEAQLQVFQAPLEELRNKVIGQTDTVLDGDRRNIRSIETNLGNLIADAILAKMQPDGAEIAIVNGGGIRASIPAGNITLGQVMEVLPFGNTIARCDFTGNQIKKLLEHGVSGVEKGEGSFPQVSGIQLMWNPEAPIGSRIMSVNVISPDGSMKPLEDDVSYRVVTNTFLMTGGDGYEIFKQSNNQVDTGFLLSDVVADYISDRPLINPPVGDRIIKAPL